MGLQFFKWLFPIAIELVKGNQRLKLYTKRNLSIMFLGFAGIVSLLLNLYFFEQSSTYGAKHKDSHSTVVTLTEKLETCSAEIKHLNETTTCLQPEKGQINNE